MLQTFFHAWERRLASVTTDRVVRPFEWGLDWIPANGHGRPRQSRRADAARTASASGSAHVMADTDAFFTPPPTRDYTLSDRSSRRRAPAHVSHGPADAASREQHGVVPLVRSAADRRPARRRPRAAAVERGRGRPRRAVPAAQLERPERAAPQPAVSRSAHAARAPSRRLHRQRQRRADGAGVPAGGARCAARHRVARGGGLRAHRHPRDRASDRASRC